MPYFKKTKNIYMSTIKETIRIDSDIVTEVMKYKKSHDITNKQEAYRRLILSGLMNETKFDKSKVIGYERELLKDIKVIKNMLIDGDIISQSKTLELNENIGNSIGDLNIFREL